MSRWLSVVGHGEFVVLVQVQTTAFQPGALGCSCGWLWLRRVLAVRNGLGGFGQRGWMVTWPAWQIFNANNALKSKASHVCGITAREADTRGAFSSHVLAPNLFNLTRCRSFFMSCCWCCSLVLMLRLGACKSAFYSTGLPVEWLLYSDPDPDPKPPMPTWVHKFATEWPSGEIHSWYLWPLNCSGVKSQRQRQ